MTIEDRVRQLMADAVADEPPPRGAPLERALQRRRPRPALVGAVAFALVLAAVVGLVAVRDRQRTLPATSPTQGWKTYTGDADNYRFRYPPDWRIEEHNQGLRLPKLLRLVPPEQASLPQQQQAVVVNLVPEVGFWIGEDWFGPISLGRLPGGQAYLRTEQPAVLAPPEEAPSPPGTSTLGRSGDWSVDWGRPCLTGEPRCASRNVRVSLVVADERQWDRHAATVEALVRTLEQLRPTAPSTGDRGLPACAPDQWRLLWPGEYGGTSGAQAIAVQGGVRYLRGPRCHLRLTVRLELRDGGGRLLPVDGNPASMVWEGDLPIDGLRRQGANWATGLTPMWRFIWDDWCNDGLPEATLRVTADRAAITIPGFDPAVSRAREGAGRCLDRGRPSMVAAWP
jgi:hypothetical protein